MLFHLFLQRQVTFRVYNTLQIQKFIVLSSEYPFLQGRCFVFASQYCKVLPASIASQYLEAALAVIEASEPGVPVKVSAVKAIRK